MSVYPLFALHVSILLCVGNYLLYATFPKSLNGGLQLAGVVCSVSLERVQKIFYIFCSLSFSSQHHSCLISLV